jgi:hypothetical protein
VGLDVVAIGGCDLMDLGIDNMKKLALIFTMAVALFGGIGACYAEPRGGLPAVNPRPGEVHGDPFHAGHRHRVVAVVVSPSFYVGPAFAPYYYPNDSYYPPSQPAYVEQDPPADLEQQVGGYWYYCADPAAYYPYVLTCPTMWLLVAP